MNTLFARKVQQSQRFLENGTRVPVTLVMAEGNVVMGLKNVDRDNYTAVKMGFGKTKKTTKALFGEMKKANFDFVPEVIGEVRVSDSASVELGTVMNVEDVFKPGDIVDVTGTSKGKGFASGIKRYNFRGGPKTHGQSDRHRAPGSIGSGTTPGRVYRGKRMAGNMGRDTVTVKNLIVIDVNSTDKTLLIKGLIPGILNGIIKVTKVGEVKDKNYVPLFKVEEASPTTQTEIVEDVSVSSASAEEAQTVQEAPQEAIVEEKKAESQENVVEAQQEVASEEKEEVKEAQNG